MRNPTAAAHVAFVALVALCRVGAGEEEVLLDTCRDASAWRFSPGGEFPGARGALRADESPAASGLTLVFDFTGGGAYVAAEFSGPVPPEPVAFGLELTARQDCRVNWRVADGTGRTFQGPGAALAAGERKTIVVPVAGPWPGAWGGKDAPRPAEPVRSLSLLASKDGTPAPKGEIAIHLPTGRVVPISGTLRIDQISTIMLPRKYHDLLDRYKLSGHFSFSGQASADPSRSAWECKLVDASLVLPAEDGGLSVEHLSGTLAMSGDGVEIRQLRGQIPQAGKAIFTLSGRYMGLDENSPFDLKLSAPDLTLPAFKDLAPPLARILQPFYDACDPSGKTSLELGLKRSQQGVISCDGTAQPTDFCTNVKYFPYRLEGAKGTVHFDLHKVVLEDMAARHGSTQFVTSGTIEFGKQHTTLDLRVKSDSLALDQDLRRALPDTCRSAWDAVDPKGSSPVNARIWRDSDGDEHYDVWLEPDGKLSATYEKFPYPLQKLRGRVQISEGSIHMESLNSQLGPARMTLSGDIQDLPNANVDMAVTARNMPIDQTLAAAMGPRGKQMMEALSPTGTLPRITARITRQKGQDLQYAVTASIKDTSLKPKALPYQIDGASGSVQLTPGKLVFAGIEGRHGQSQVNASGTVWLYDKDLGLKLNINAPAMVLDQDIYAALPQSVRLRWDQLKPAGTADLDLELACNTPDEKDLTYKATITPRRMSAKYRDLPYAFENVTGKAVITPNEVELLDVAAGSGKATASVSGQITSDAGGSHARLRLSAKDMPLEARLLAAMPAQMKDLGSRLRPGGTFSFDISPLELDWQPDAPAAQTRSGVPVPAAGIAWRGQGTISFDGAVIDVGRQPKTLTGQVVGSAGGGAEGLDFRGDINLKDVSVRSRTISDFRGRITKTARSQIIHLDQLSAKSCGGKLAGAAEIKLGASVEYALRLDVLELDLEELINAGVADPKARVKFPGKLSGKLSYAARPGQNPSQQAAGELYITKAKIGKLPVMLDMLNVLYLSLPGDSMFTEGSMKYVLRDNNLVMQEILLDGPAMSVVGSGSMNMKNETLDLTFLTALPGKLKPIGVLGELLQGISREVTEWHLTGSPAKPRMSARPLRSVDKALRTLLNPSSEEN